MSDAVSKIKAKLNIVDVVGARVELKKAGIHYKGLCPFHNEKTPSFTVSPERNSFYCFGCGAKGDIFSFVEEYEGVDFKQALNILADKAGVDLSEYSFSPKKKVDKNLYTIMDNAVEYYRSVLQTDSDAMNYLKERGLTQETINNWKIGYARDEWRNLYDFLTEKKIERNDLLKAGLIKETDKKDKVYDVFRGRIIFPIQDILGRTVAFTGRILVDKENAPKYLNTGETEIFNKSEVLFGLDYAKQSIRKLDYIILVEGQMDVIMSHQAGVKNVVASSGTAFTPEHLQKISPMTKRILFAFDSDDAGINAMKRSALLALKSGFDTKVLVLKEGKDPAELVKKDPSIWIESIKESKPVIDYLLNRLIKENTEERQKIKKISTDIIPFINSLKSSIEKAHYVKKVSELFSIDETAVWNEIKNTDELTKNIPQIEIEENTQKEIPNNSIKRESAIYALFKILSQKDNKESEKVKKELSRIAGENILEELKEKYEDKIDEIIFKTEALYLKQEESNINEILNELLILYEIEYIDKEINNLKKNLKYSEQQKDDDKSQKLLKEYKTLQEKKSNLLDKKS